MAFIRLKRRGARQYAYLVESKWQPGVDGPRQHILAYLGPRESITRGDVPEAYRDEPAVVRWFEREASPDPDPELAARLRAALLAADREAVNALADAAVRAEGITTFLERTLVPLLHRIGEDWHAGTLSVADERAASSTASELVRRLRARAAEERRVARGRQAVALLLTPEGERHDLALLVLECRLAAAGHRALVLGGGAPRRDLAARARQLDPDLVLISSTMTETRAEAVALANAILERCPRALVALGGQAWHGEAPDDLDPRAQVASPRAAVETLAREALERRTMVSA